MIADIRGTGDSTGCYDFGGRLEQQDGRAIVDWIAAQEWSDGTVGMTGISLEALSQFATAITAPPALRAIVPTSASDPYGNIRAGGLIGEPGPLYGPWMSPPLVRAGSLCDPGHVAHEYEQHGWRDAWWQERSMALHAHRIEAAVLYAVGNPLDVTWGFGSMWQALEDADVPRKGLLGPWGHERPTIGWWFHHELRWFEHHLRGIDTGVMAEPRITLIDRDGNVASSDRFEWRATVLTAGGGALARRVATGSATYTDRPEVPRYVTETDPTAHLRYHTAPLARDTHVTGTPRLEVVASIDRDDTNLLAVLYDVAPDGSRRYVTRGMLDAQLRDGIDRPPRPVPIGVPQRYRIDLFPRHHLVPAGHRLLLVLTSSEACYDCGHPEVADYLPWPVVSDPHPATVTVHEGPGQTRLRLPLAPA